MNPTGQLVALLAPMHAALPSWLADAGHRVVDAALDPLLAARATVAVTRGSLATGDEVLARLPELRLLCCWGSGYDGIDLAATARRGVTVCNNPGGNAASVADLAIGFVVSLLRGVPAAERHLRGGHWQDPAMRLPAAPGLTGARLGLFGYGEVGRRVASRAAALEMAVGCHGRRRIDEPGVICFDGLEALATWADVLVLAARADESTRHAVNAKVLAALGPRGHLVNVARGSLIDETALCDVLASGRLAGFASDVFEDEPHVPAAVLAFPNAVLTPHIGGATQHAQRAIACSLLANIDSHFSTGRPRHPVG